MFFNISRDTASCNNIHSHISADFLDTKAVECLLKYKYNIPIRCPGFFNDENKTSKILCSNYCRACDRTAVFGLFLKLPAWQELRKVHRYEANAIRKWFNIPSAAEDCPVSFRNYTVQALLEKGNFKNKFRKEMCRRRLSSLQHSRQHLIKLTRVASASRLSSLL